MTAGDPGVRFSIRPDTEGWRWSAMRDGLVLGSGVAPTRALAAALVIRQICLSHETDGGQRPGLAEAA